MTRLFAARSLMALLALPLIGIPHTAAEAHHRSGYHHRHFHHAAERDRHSRRFVYRDRHVAYRRHGFGYSDRYSGYRSQRWRTRTALDGCIYTNEGRQICRGAAAPARMSAAFEAGRSHAYAYASADRDTVIGSRPSGCPHAYCGCGLRKYLGLSDVRLNLASNWARLFPREASPRPGLAAVRSGHVMYIEAAAGNGQWLIRDYNSGGGLSRLHVRDVRGYVLVNPRG